MSLFSRSLAPVLLLGCLAVPFSAAAAEPAKLLRDRPAEARPHLMLVAVPHLANHGRDVLNTQVPDVLEPQRQKEIAAIVAALAKFKPNKIALELPIDSQDKLDARYKGYRDGSFTPTRSEVDQLGLRLAARLSHARVYAVDWNKMPPGKVEDFDWLTWGEKNGQKAWLDAIRDQTSTNQMNAFMRETPVGAWLAHYNSPDRLEHSNRRYYDFAMIGDSENYTGANWVGNWYARNLKIFANLVRLADQPGDRVLVIYGASHVFPLQQYAQQSGAFIVESPMPLLQEAAAASR